MYKWWHDGTMEFTVIKRSQVAKHDGSHVIPVLGGLKQEMYTFEVIACYMYTILSYRLYARFKVIQSI